MREVSGFKELKIALEFLYFLAKCNCEDIYFIFKAPMESNFTLAKYANSIIHMLNSLHQQCLTLVTSISFLCLLTD